VFWHNSSGFSPIACSLAGLTFDEGGQYAGQAF
jgi:hypothetical protein